jgi:acyl-CoA synthetase (AMP-forming)/AMP-acid ligase II
MSCRSVLLHTIPLFHANGWGTAHTITVVGGTHVMLHHFNPAEVFRLIERERVTACAIVPTMATALLHSPERQKFDLSSLQLITIGGAASSPTLVKEVEQVLRYCMHFRLWVNRNFSDRREVAPKPDSEWDGEDAISARACTGFRFRSRASGGRR